MDECVCHCFNQSVTWVLAVKYICIIIIPIDPAWPAIMPIVLSLLMPRFYSRDLVQANKLRDELSPL